MQHRHLKVYVHVKDINLVIVTKMIVIVTKNYLDFCGKDSWRVIFMTIHPNSQRETT